MQPLKTEKIHLSETETLNVADLPDELRGLIELHDRWKNDERDAQVELHKVAMAIRGISSEIAQKLQAHLNPVADDAEEAAVEEAAVETAVV